MAKSLNEVHATRPATRAQPEGLQGTAALLAMLGIAMVILLSALDQTIVGTALPSVVAELKGFDLYAWVATSYLLTSTIMVPLMGKIGDLSGCKPFLLAAIVIFEGRTYEHHLALRAADPPACYPASADCAGLSGDAAGI